MLRCPPRDGKRRQVFHHAHRAPRSLQLAQRVQRASRPLPIRQIEASESSLHRPPPSGLARVVPRHGPSISRARRQVDAAAHKASVYAPTGTPTRLATRRGPDPSEPRTKRPTHALGRRSPFRSRDAAVHHSPRASVGTAPQHIGVRRARRTSSCLRMVTRPPPIAEHLARIRQLAA